MYVYGVYPAMSISPNNCQIVLKRAETTVFVIVFDGAIYTYTVTTFSLLLNINE
jgi:hypothetical protein